MDEFETYKEYYFDSIQNRDTRETTEDGDMDDGHLLKGFDQQGNALFFRADRPDSQRAAFDRNGDPVSESASKQKNSAVVLIDENF